MRFRTLLCLVVLSLTGLNGYAQTDSLYMQQWGRDAVTNFNSTTSAQRQIITKETIRNSGYTRVSDLLQLIDAWTFTTTTGDQLSLQSNGTGNYENPNWILMLNGQRIEPKGNIANDINLLGVNAWDIERIEVVNSVGLFLGEYASGGIIHIVTKKGTQAGVYARAAYSYGLSTIDSKRSTEAFNNSQNASATIGYSRNKHHLAGSVNYAYYANQDTIIRSLLQYPNFSTTLNGSRIEYQYSGKKLIHQLQYIYADYTQPNTSVYQNISYLGLWNMTPHHQIRLSLSENQRGSSSYTNNSIQYRYLSPRKKGNLIWQTGLSYTTAEKLFNYIKPFTTLTLPVTRKTTVWGETQFAFANQQAHPKFTLGLYKRVSFISNYSFVFAYGTVENSAWYYLPFNPAPSTMSNPVSLNQYSSTQATADFYYNIGFGNNVKFSFHSGLKHSDNLGSNEYLILNLPGSVPIVDQVTDLHTFQTNWVNQLNFHYDIINNLVLDINYMHTGRVDTWNDNLRNIPKHKFTITAQYNFKKKFSIWARNYWQSETQWWNETQLRGDQPAQTTEVYSPLPLVYRWDIGINKNLYKEHIHLNFSVRNLFNANERYAPAGAQFDLRFVASVAANINGLFVKNTSKP